MEIFHVRPIPTHGGSIRVYAAKRGARAAQASVGQMLAAELSGNGMTEKLTAFSASGAAFEAAAAIDVARAEGERRANSRHWRGRARDDFIALRWIGRGHHRLCLRSCRIAENRTMHARYTNPCGR